MPINKEEVIFYLKNMLVIYNIEAKTYEIVYEESSMENEQILKIKHFFLENKIMICIVKVINNLPYVVISLFRLESFKKVHKNYSIIK